MVKINVTKRIVAMELVEDENKILYSQKIVPNYLTKKIVKLLK